ncbi:MAG: hypothetical protein J6M12_02200 [Clostridia bacterium]|nr:hypothetical protein [Clostridia bacterium]
MEYNVNPNKKKPLLIVLTLFAAGLAVALLPTIFDDIPQYVCHLPALVLFGICIALLSRFVLTDYTYQLKDSPDTMSSYPKFNVYRIRKAGSRMTYCIPFNNILSVKKVEKVKNPGCPHENLCASMAPDQVYLLTYFVDTSKEAIFIECNDRFAKEIDARIRTWSQVQDFEDEN